MPVLEGEGLVVLIAPKKTAAPKKVEAVADASEAQEEQTPKPAKKAPQVKAKKEYTGPFVEGEDF